MNIGIDLANGQDETVETIIGSNGRSILMHCIGSMIKGIVVDLEMIERARRDLESTLSPELIEELRRQLK